MQPTDERKGLRGIVNAMPPGLQRQVRRLGAAITGRPPGPIEIPPEARRGQEQALTAVHPWGPVLDAMAAAAEAAPKPAGYGAEYDLIKPFFDMPYYLGRYRDLATQAYDPVAHYIRAGHRENRDPAPWFGTLAYQARYGAEIAKSGLTPFGHWVKHGRAKGYVTLPFDEFEYVAEKVMNRPAAEMQKVWTDRYDDLRQRLETGKLAEMVQKATALDPLVEATWPAALNIRIPPFNTNLSVSRIAAMHKLQSQAGMRTARAVIVVNRPRWGGGRRAEGHLAHALAARYGADEVLVIATEGGGKMPKGKLPKGVRYVDFPATLDATTARNDPRQRLYVEFIRSLHPQVIFGVNSNLFWQSLERYGLALKATSDLYGVMFCPEVNEYGHRTGWPIKHFYRHFDVLAGLGTDSAALAQELTDRWVLPPEWQQRVRVLPAPVDPAIPEAAPPADASGRRPQIFWSGRFDRQKRLDIVHAVARALPEVDIRLWGEEVMGTVTPLAAPPPNVKVMGTYTRFADLPLSEADLWLYTSAWDGVPSLLLEVGLTGVPIVGSLAGGTGEVLDPALSWPVDGDDPDPYVAAIRAILADPAAARARAAGLRARLLETRTEAAYAEALQALMQGGTRT